MARVKRDTKTALKTGAQSGKFFTMNLKLISYQHHLDGEGEFIAWTVLFDDLDRGRRMVAMIYGDALFELTMYPVCKAFNVESLAQGNSKARNTCVGSSSA
jgi:hypothetical protein